MAAALYGISGIRWYFGLIAAFACLPFFALTILRTWPRAARLAGAAVAALFLFASVLIGSRTSMSVVMTFVRPDKPRILEVPRAFVTYLHYSRAGFERTGGTTMIGAGHAISAVDAQLGNREEHVAPIRTNEKEVAPKPAEVHPALAVPVSTASTRPPAPKFVEVRDVPTSVDHEAVASKPAEKTPAVTNRKPPSKASFTTASTPPAPTSVKVPVASASTEKEPVAPKPSETRKTASTAASNPASTQAPSPAAKTPAVVMPASTAVAKAAPPPARVITPKPAAVPVPKTSGTAVSRPDDAATGTVAIPASHTARFLAGTAAMVLPRAIAQRLGILDVRGGRGLWLFVEVDTIAFDVVLVFCFAAVIGAVRRRELRAPVFWLILTVTVVVGGLLAYTVSNFGTLFRHREMVLLGLLLLPLAALPAKSQVPVPVPEDVHDVVGDVPDAAQSV